MRILTLVIIGIALSGLLDAQNENAPYYIKGIISDDRTNERLEGAAVFCGDTLVSLSDNTGYFQFGLGREIKSIKIKLVGYEEKTVEINTAGDEIKNAIRLIPKPIILNSVTINGEHFAETPVINSYSIQPGELSKIPQFIEVDAFKAFQALPGVTTASDLSAQISVRGGNYDETRVILDGIPIYNPYHLVGMFSMFNSDILRNERLYLSVYPAYYGGALSSVLELNTKTGNNERIKGNISVGLASSKAELDGPLFGGNFLISARRTYFDAVGSILNVRFPYSFYDLYSKYIYPVCKNNLLSVSAFYSSDIYNLENENTIVNLKESPNWGNLFFNVTNEYFFSDNSSADLKVFYSRAFLGMETNILHFSSANQGETLDTTSIDNYIDDITARLNLNFHPEGQELSLGMEIKKQSVHYNWTIDDTDLNGIYIHPLEDLFYDYAQNPFNYDRKENYISGYITDKIRLSKKSIITAGLRGTFIKSLKTLVLLPSLTYNYSLNPNLVIVSGFGRNFQNTYSLKENKNEAVFTPFMTSFLSENKGNVSFSENYSLGLVLSNILSGKTSLELEGYYKKRSNLATSYGKSEDIKFEEGSAAGIDVLLKREEGTVTGWIGYSFMRSVKKNEDFSYYAPLDRTHGIKLLCNYNLSNSWQLNSFWTYSTGLPFTSVIGKFVGPPKSNNSGQGFGLIEGRRNNERFSGFHRLDVGISGSFLWGSILYKPYLQIMNVYNSPNPYSFKPSSWQVTPEEGQERGSSIFPVIGITAEF